MYVDLVFYANKIVYLSFDLACVTYSHKVKFQKLL